MYPLLQPINYVTVNDMYNFSQLKNSPLLSDFDADFWTEYRNNYPRYDSLFKRMFKGFRYFDQSSYTEDDKDEAIENVTNDFTDQVYLHLMMNRKRYSELYRIWDIDDENYSVTTGYLYNETHTETGGENSTQVEGARDDSTAKTKGAQANTETDAYGAKTNIYTDEKGGHTDTKSVTTGSQTNNSEITKGAHTDAETVNKATYTDSDIKVIDPTTDTTQTSKQSYTDSTTHQVQGFNSTGWNDSDLDTTNGGARSELVTESKAGIRETDTFTGGAREETKSTAYGQAVDSTSETLGSRNDSESTVYGSHTDTDTESLGAHTDTKTINEGSRSDSESFSKGEQTNTDESEYERTLTIKRDGNIGNQSVTDILEKHEKYWNRFNFYKLIFADICKEMLLVN